MKISLSIIDLIDKKRVFFAIEKFLFVSLARNIVEVKRRMKSSSVEVLKEKINCENVNVKEKRKAKQTKELRKPHSLDQPPTALSTHRTAKNRFR
jgi:hypothetical protein